MYKELFNSVVVSNRILQKLVFYKVKQINQQLKDEYANVYRWDRLIQSPYMLLGFKYYDLFEKYLMENMLFVENNFDILCYLVELIKIGRIDSLKSIIGKFRIFNRELLNYLKKGNEFYLRSVPFPFTHNLLAYAVKYRQSDIISYLESLDSIDTQLWDYLEVAELSIRSFDLDTFKYYINKYKSNTTTTSVVDQLNKRLNILVAKSASAGKLDFLEWILNNIGKYTPTYKVLKKTIKNNHLNCFVYLISLTTAESTSPLTKDSDKRSLLDYACKYNRLDIVKWIHYNSNESYSERSLRYACDHKNISMFKFLIKNKGYDFFEDYVYSYALSSQSLEIIKWMHTHLSKIDYDDNVLSIAFESKNLEILEWIDKNIELEEKQIILTNDVNYIYSSYPMELVEWFDKLVERGVIDGNGNHGAMDKAAQNNDFERMKWIHYNKKLGCSNVSINAAISNKNFEMLKWLHVKYGDLRYSIQSFEITYNCEILDWLQQNKHLLQLPSSTTSQQQKHQSTSNYLPMYVWIRAAEKGDIEKMKWLHLNRSDDYAYNVITYKHTQWNKDILLAALRSKNVELLDWIKEKLPSTINDSRFHSRDMSCVYLNGNTISFEVVEWISRLGHPDLVPDVNQLECAILRSFDIFIYLIKKYSMPITINLLKYAVMNNRLQVIQWILETNIIPIEFIKNIALSWENNFKVLQDPYNLIINFLEKNN